MRLETGYGRQQKGDKRRERRGETGDWRRETREGRQEKGEETGDRCTV